MRRDIDYPDIDWKSLPSPCYVVDEALLVRNLALLREVADAAGCKILLAQKGFSMFALYPLIAEHLAGAAASSLYEARLAAEEMGKETHIYSPAYREDEFAEIAALCSHVIFNSFGQWRKFRAAASAGAVSCGIRVNPGYSEIATPLYNPCAPFSRLGVPYGAFAAEASGRPGLEGISGLHFHTMCEQNSDTLARTLGVVREKFGAFLRGHDFKWVNFGGGHHITRADYDVETLVRCVREFIKEFGVDVYLEPGEAIALNTGFLAATVLDIVDNGMKIAILDASAACHMPDVLEMPYRPAIIGSAAVPNAACDSVDPSGEGYYNADYAHVYRLGGPTCLAGDIIGDYAFKAPLAQGDRIVFTDMAHYTMVKNNTFNGIGLPAIVFNTRDGCIRTIRRFGYDDFKNRLS